jgi:CHASE3 domain sensor protein
MQQRSVRITVLTLLLAAPLAAAFFLWTIDRRTGAATATADAVAMHAVRIRDAIAEIGAAQQGYVAPGQLDEPWFERTDAQIEALRDELTAVRALVRSADAVAALDALTGSIDALAAADARTRQNLTVGQDLMAADVIFSDGRNVLDAMVAELRTLQRAERDAYGADLMARARTQWAVFAIMALGWIAAAGLLLHVGRVLSDPPARRLQKDPAYAADTKPAAPVPAIRPSVDLAAAAALCTDLSRVTETSALRAIFSRATSLLDASGLTLWMSAGEQLFAVLGHGYPPEDLARFGPIVRTADNAAAAAWRTGRLSVVAGDAQTPGALVAPMFGPAGCVGVLAFEVRHGREQDPAVQAVAAMVAAQLATAVAAWPAASAAPAAQEPAARTA